jgi:hypothetical protein
MIVDGPWTVLLAIAVAQVALLIKLRNLTNRAQALKVRSAPVARGRNVR